MTHLVRAPHLSHLFHFLPYLYFGKHPQPYRPHQRRVLYKIDGRFPAHASKLSTLPANSYLTGTNSSNQNSMAVCETPNLYNRDVEYTLIIEYTVNMSMTF